MKIGILGAGNVGAALARAWAAKAHQVMFGVSNPKSERVSKALAELGGKARAGTNAEGAAFGEVVALAVPWPAAEETIRCSGSFAGKVLIDSTNPLPPDFKSLNLGHSISAWEMVARRARGARAAKA